MTRRRGFTLLELLLALAMVAMLMLALYTGFVTAFRAQAIANKQGDATRQAKVALDLVEQDLRSILPPKDGGLAGPFIGQQGGEAIIDCYPLGTDYGRTDSPLANGFRHVKIALLPDNDSPPARRRRTCSSAAWCVRWPMSPRPSRSPKSSPAT